MAKATKYKIDIVEKVEDGKRPKKYYGPMVGIETLAEIPKRWCEELVCFEDFKYLEEQDFILYLDYPLGSPVRIELKNVGTVGELVWHIGQVYKQIYLEEDATATKKAPRKTLLNRGASNGKYGINLHDIGDLVIESIIISADNVVYPVIGS